MQGNLETQAAAPRRQATPHGLHKRRGDRTCSRPVSHPADRYLPRYLMIDLKNAHSSSLQRAASSSRMLQWNTCPSTRSALW